MNDDNVVPFSRRGKKPVLTAMERIPVATLELWLKRTNAIDIAQDEDGGPYATPGTGVAGYPFSVWATNGESDPRAWAGTMLARCRTQEDADLVAEALRRMQADRE